MGAREKLRRLEAALRGKLESFELRDGSRYFHDPQETFKVVFLHWCDCLRAGSAHNWPPAPEAMRKSCEAKDVEGAPEQVRGEGSWDTIAYDLEVLINERRLEPRPLVSRYDPQAGKHVLIDPYEDDGVEDLSE